ncbi:MAG: type I DNA topoisomerase [Vulcanimicrobiota bacterium]
MAQETKTKTKKTTTRKAAAKTKTTAKKPKATKKTTRKTTRKAKKKSGKKKDLIIVESPAKARTIEKLSGGKFNVKASMGHVRDLPKSRLGVNVEENYEPHYISIRGKKDIINDLKSGVKNATQVLLASDPDREGEAIAWHLAHMLKVNEPKRIELHEITKTGFENALNNTRNIDLDLVNAQQARRILDRLVGYKLSPLLWRKISYGLSAGRVQSVAVKLICERQKEIDNFEPEEYWSMDVLLSKLGQKKKDAFEASMAKIDGKKPEIPDKEASDKILSEIKNKDFVVSAIKKKNHRKNPYPPFKTSTLQQEAHKRLGFTAKRTMSLAQQLYEGMEMGSEGIAGLITYMRTDSARISKIAQEEAKGFIENNYGDKYYGKGRVYKSSASAQEAHEAIRPTSISRTPQMMKKYLNASQFKLYKLIWERFMASQMASAQLETTTIDINVEKYLFRASDTKVTFEGFMKIYESSEKKEKGKKQYILPQLQENEKLKVYDFLPKQHFTQPPPPFTEATLIKTMEEKGIGRPSTYAPIVDRIQKRKYVELKEKKFRPTELGFTVTDMLQEHFPTILDVNFTAGMEEKLDKIEEGEQDWVEVVDKFYKPFEENLVEAEKKIPKQEIKPEPTDEICDKCEKPMVIKRGRYGKFIACSGYPECKNTKPLLIEIGVPCPRENCDGQLIERKSRKGKFYGCSKYPECNFASWDKPINEKCPKCGSIMVLRFSKSGKSYKTCSDADCSKKS